MIAAAASCALRDVDRPFAVAERPDGPRFPNGYVPAAWQAGRDRPAGRRLDSEVIARRWWDPGLRVERLVPERVATLLRLVEPMALPHPPEAGIGWGPGLTPAGDDVVVGMLLGYRAAGSTATADALAGACTGQETTALSRSLLDHAAEGRAVRPLLALLEALAAPGRVADRRIECALVALRRFGASSGQHVIEGVRRALLDESRAAA